jgi:hypothetical protein
MDYNELNSYFTLSKLDNLQVRTGVYATLFVVRGHINDTVQSVMHGTDNSEDFWEDVYEHPMADFLRQYEQWACTQNQSAHFTFLYTTSLFNILQILTNRTLWKWYRSRYIR